MENIIKILTAAVMIFAATEVAKRVPRVGGLILSLPLTSIIALIWLYATKRDTESVAALSWSTFWFVVPSLLLFLLLPLFLRRGLPFSVALVVSSVITVSAYWGWPTLLSKFGIRL